MRHLFSLLFLLVLAVAGCSSSADLRHYSLTGQVVSLEPRSQEAVLRHQEIPGYMPAMTMGYHVQSASEFAKLKPGQTIHADLVVSSDRSWLEKVQIINEASAAPATLTEYHYPQPGETVPPFTVTDQDGRKFELSRHYPALVTFVYTRCPLPDYCPRLNSNFQQVAAKLRDTAHPDLHLVTISFDPEYDTPAVLKKFRDQWATNPQLKKEWTFAVPAKQDLPALLKYFAVNAYPDQGLLAHSLSTTLISQDGKVLAWWHGNDWTAEDVAQKLGR
jgi:protein SCO1/2